MKRRFVWLAIAALAIALGVLLYRGPGRAIVRGNVGDVAAATFVYAIVGALLSRRASRVAATLAIAVAIELGQIVWHADSTAGKLLIGSTFDPWDLVAYVIGVAIALGWDDRRSARQAKPVAGLTDARAADR